MKNGDPKGVFPFESPSRKNHSDKALSVLLVEEPPVPERHPAAVFIDKSQGNTSTVIVKITEFKRMKPCGHGSLACLFNEGMLAVIVNHKTPVNTEQASVIRSKGKCIYAVMRSIEIPLEYNACSPAALGHVRELHRIHDTFPVRHGTGNGIALREALEIPFGMKPRLDTLDLDRLGIAAFIICYPWNALTVSTASS